MTRTWKRVFPESRLEVKDIFRDIPVVLETSTSYDEFYVKPKQLFTVFTLTPDEIQNYSGKFVTNADGKLYASTDALCTGLRAMIDLREKVNTVPVKAVHRLKSLFTGQGYYEVAPEHAKYLEVGVNLKDGYTVASKYGVIIKKLGNVITVSRRLRDMSFFSRYLEDAPICRSFLKYPVLHIVTPEDDIIQVSGIDENNYHHVVTVAFSCYWGE